MVTMDKNNNVVGATLSDNSPSAQPCEPNQQPPAIPTISGPNAVDEAAVKLSPRGHRNRRRVRCSLSASSTGGQRAAQRPQLFARLPPRIKILCANAGCILIFLGYALFGGLAILYLEVDADAEVRATRTREKQACVLDALSTTYEANSRGVTKRSDGLSLSATIARRCLIDNDREARREWTLKSAFMFGFGLLTTLGYSRIEPRTTQSRMFAVAWGLLGVPFAVIILSNLGMYLRCVERFLRKCIGRLTVTTVVGNASDEGGGAPSTTLAQPQQPPPSTAALGAEDSSAASKSDWNILPISLALFVLLHLTLGAIFLPLLNVGHLDFINGFYYCYISFTGMEYGGLVDHENSYFPVVLVYNCVGLAMSTIVLNVSSMYAKKLYYCSRRVGDFAHAKIWIGSKHLRVRELLSALGQSIGVDPEAFCKLDLDQMIEDAILVKEGRLPCVPQAYTFLEGIWPPELVPLFLRDGHFPEYADAESGGSTTAVSAAAAPTAATTANSGGQQITEGERSALQAALHLSTFAEGHLHRTLCPTAPTAAPPPKPPPSRNGRHVKRN